MIDPLWASTSVMGRWNQQREGLKKSLGFKPLVQARDYMEQNAPPTSASISSALLTE